MKKLKLKFALKLVNFGIWLYDSNSDMPWDEEDRSNVKKLWEMRNEIKLEL